MIRPGKEYKSLTSEAASHGCPIHRGVRTYRLLMGARWLRCWWQDHHRAVPEQDRQGRQAPLLYPRHSIPRSSARRWAAQGSARCSGQDRPQSL